ncbi:uncharacterized protein C1orf127 homolog [Petaurus breviceps papuanus]|uniref:uncharacterized protein C1orf127 homolog n=1 Tax=Petaurus breviceps papuanus TaxID=3040969 RepID=UPI0036DD4BE2
MFLPSIDDIECFSDYMALWIPKSHVHGLKQWLSITLNVPVNWGSMERLNSFLARCGYFLHPDSAGNYIFYAHYTACFVQQQNANYLLEIRMFQKGIKNFGQSDRYILKCPVITSRLSQESILCGPDTIQVSRPMPQGNARRQSPWLLSLRGELVASLEDASLLGLYVETNNTTITILGPRQQLLQRKEVMNTSVDFLSLWMVSGYFAYSLEAICPLVSSQPGSEVLVQIPKQGLGLVKRRSRYTEALTLRDLRVSQSSSFTVTENRDFVVVSLPAGNVLQSQQCQEAQGGPRMQSFYRIDLSLEFAEVAGPVHWTVENFFHCADSDIRLEGAAGQEQIWTDGDMDFDEQTEE